MPLNQKVIILNKPLKLFGLTVKQWIFMVPAAIIAFWAGSSMPHNWKIQNLPAGFVLGMFIVCGALVAIHMNEVRPGTWWVNLFYYNIFRVMPTVYLPHMEEEPLYIDASIMDKKDTREEYYVQ